MSDAGDDTSDWEVGVPETAGNDADVEDNLQPPYTPVPDIDGLREKLRRSAPEECAPITPCKLLHDREETRKNGSARMASATDRLSTRPKSGVEMIGDTIEKPRGAVPPMALPHWHCLPLDKKIPLLPAPAGFMYYSPGKVSEKLQRQPKLYSLYDPYNRERIVRCPYSAVSDPHAKSFVDWPTTKKILHNQGFINDNDEIMVPLCEFNKYRDYLRTLYTDEVSQSLRQADELYKKEREQIRLINQYLNAEDGRPAEQQRKIANSRRMIRMAEHYKTDRLLKKQQQTKTRMEMWAKERERIYLEKLVRNAQKGRMQEEKLRVLRKEKQMEANRTLQQVMMRDLRSSERRAQDMELLRKTNEAYLMEWIDTKIHQSQARLDKEQTISRSWRETLKSRAKARQKRMEAMRADLPNLVERRRKEEARLLEVARKYFYIWLEKTRKKKNTPADETHTSVWVKGASGTLDSTVNYLRFQTDTHDKLDDFILNIMRLKSAIRKQLELEGDSEGEEEGDTDKETPSPPVPQSQKSLVVRSTSPRSSRL